MTSFDVTLPTSGQSKPFTTLLSDGRARNSDNSPGINCSFRQATDNGSELWTSEGDELMASLNGGLNSVVGDESGRMRLRSTSTRTTADDVDTLTMTTTATTASRRQRRRSRDVCRPLRHWLYSHRDAPYPSRADKLQLAADTQLSLTQISNWFANARRRLKNTVDRAVTYQSPYSPSHFDDVGSGLDWAQRIRLYNRHTVGNQERLSISSSDDDDDVVDDDDDESSRDLDDVDANMDSDSGQVQSVATNHEIFHHKIPKMSVSADGDFIRQGGATVTRLGMFVGAHCTTAGDKMVLSVGVEDLELQDRHRNASGSLSSHDYEELSASSSSLRSTPTFEHQYQHHQQQQQHHHLCQLHSHLRNISPQFARDLEDDELYRLGDEAHSFESFQDGDDGAMHWKEISAALALTTLASSRTSMKARLA